MNVELSSTQLQLMKWHLTELVLSEPALERMDRHAFVLHACGQRFERHLRPTAAVAAANLLSKGLLCEVSVLGRSGYERSVTLRFSVAGAGLLFGMLQETRAATSSPRRRKRRSAA